jgi:hypothetical protein
MPTSGPVISYRSVPQRQEPWIAMRELPRCSTALMTVGS